MESEFVLSMNAVTHTFLIFNVVRDDKALIQAVKDANGKQYDKLL
jgi:hypothetical protein